MDKHAIACINSSMVTAAVGDFESDDIAGLQVFFAYRLADFHLLCGGAGQFYAMFAKSPADKPGAVKARFRSGAASLVTQASLRARGGDEVGASFAGMVGNLRGLRRRSAKGASLCHEEAGEQSEQQTTGKRNFVWLWDERKKRHEEWPEEWTDKADCLGQIRYIRVFCL